MAAEFIWFVVALLQLLVVVAAASPQPAQRQKVNRDILALYKSNEGQSEEDNPIYEFLELPLNFLGFRVQYADASRGVASLPQREYRAIAMWCWDDELPEAPQFRKWLLRQIRAGTRLLLFGVFGAVSRPGMSPTSSDLAEVREVFRALGADYRKEAWSLAQRTGRYRFHAPYFPFERDPAEDGVTGFYPLVKLSADVIPVVEVQPTGSGRTYLAGFVSPRGAFLAQPFIYRVVQSDSSGFKPQFYVDPVRFLADALGCKGEPHPDLATLFGRRLFLARIDGDGLSGQTQINPNYLCGALMRDEILVPTPLSFAASFVQGEIDPAYLGSERAVELAREIMMLPNVEPASHGLGHPMDWTKGDLMVSGLPGYTKLDPEREIFGSLEFLNRRILRGDKHSNLFLWTGYCNPPASILRAIRERGVLAINGGTSLVYEDVPSIANFNPPFRHVDGEIQILRRAANDYEFTNYWRGPFDGYRKVLTTFRYGWEHYPLVPIDLYIHFYSAERKESLQALKDVLAWVASQAICPVTNSEYIRMALDFVDTQVERLRADLWSIRTKGHLRTIRFDFDDRIVDLRRSHGVLGYCRRRGYLYVHLDEGRQHLVQLAPVDTLLDFPPFVIESGNLIREWRAEPERRRLSFVAEGFGTTDIWLAGLYPQTLYRVDSPDFRKTYFSETDSLGRLHVAVPIQKSIRLEIRPSSRTSYVMNYGRYGILLIVIVLLSVYSIALSRRRVRQLAEDDEGDFPRSRTTPTGRRQVRGRGGSVK